MMEETNEFFQDLCQWGRLSSDCPVKEMQVLLYLKKEAGEDLPQGMYRWILDEAGCRWERQPAMGLSQEDQPLFSTEVLSIEPANLRAWLKDGEEEKILEQPPYWCRFVRTGKA